jgi:hypothetical protein
MEVLRYFAIRLAIALVFLLLSLLAGRADEAVNWDGLHGRLELGDAGSFNAPDSLDAALGTPDHNDGLANLRLIWDPTWRNVSLDLQYLATAEAGEEVRLMRTGSALYAPPPATWFNLTDTFFRHGDTLAQHGIDRLSLAWSTPDFVIRLGRQALTWGSGLVFRPMDLFDPFSPTATDAEYKPGTDMLYMQYLFADGSDLQFIAVPRPAAEGGQPTSNASSLALHYHGTLFGVETTALLARDHGDWTGALGINGPLSGATWNIEALPTALRNGPVVFSALANISDAQTVFDRNATLFVEAFHNGFGVEGAATLATLPPALYDRLARGQLFNLRQDYLAAGMTLEWSPLVTVSPTAIADCDDGSVYLLLAADWSLSNTLTLVAGAQAPVGARGSEFGGIGLAPGSPIVLSPPAQLYVQLRQYF